MGIDELREAVSDARSKLRSADRVADDLADLLVGRLRKGVSAYKLKQLKRELRDFNIHTGSWKP